MRYVKDLLRVFFPYLCVGCSNELLYSEQVLCAFCNSKLPLLTINNYTDNIISNSFYGRTKIEKSTSFLSFHKKNIAQKLVHALKYKNRQDIGSYLGYCFADSLNNGNFMNGIDCIIPVPIHPSKHKKRGYNQITTFCISLGKTFSIPIHTSILVRKKNNTSQTSKNRYERNESLHLNFELTNSMSLKNKHVVLVDDVITTGATIEACCHALLKTSGIKISILSIAFTENS